MRMDVANDNWQKKLTKNNWQEIIIKVMSDEWWACFVLLAGGKVLLAAGHPFDKKHKRGDELLLRRGKMIYLYEAVSDQGPVWVQREAICQGSWKMVFNDQICSNYHNMMHWARILQKITWSSVLGVSTNGLNHLAAHMPILGHVDFESCHYSVMNFRVLRWLRGMMWSWTQGVLFKPLTVLK